MQFSCHFYLVRSTSRSTLNLWSHLSHSALTLARGTWGWNVLYSRPLSLVIIGVEGMHQRKETKIFSLKLSIKVHPFFGMTAIYTLVNFFWMSFRSFSITHFPSGYEIQLTPSSFSNPIPFPGGMEIVLSKPQLGKPQLIMLISFHSHSNSLFLLTVIRAKSANCANRCS